MMWIYLTSLCTSIAGLALLDRRYSLAIWHDTWRTVLTIATGVGLFVVWDLIGISLGIFFHGGSELTLPLRLAPQFPVEELFFLTLLCYVTLLIYRSLEKR